MMKEKKIASLCAEVDVVFQSTSLGINENDPSPLSQKFLCSHHCVLDMIYHRTRFQTECKKRGMAVVNGLGMLLHQGAKSFEIWTDKQAPVSLMRKSLLNMSD